MYRGRKTEPFLMTRILLPKYYPDLTGSPPEPKSETTGNPSKPESTKPESKTQTKGGNKFDADYKIGLKKKTGAIPESDRRKLLDFAKKMGCTSDEPLIKYEKVPLEKLYPLTSSDMKFYDSITPDLGRTTYERRTTGRKISNHWGQRKLFLSELILFNEVAKRKPDWSKVVFVYAGSAAGQHLVLLAEMFPIAKFILYDPNKFSEYLYDFAVSEIANLPPEDQIYESIPEQGFIRIGRFEFHTSGRGCTPNPRSGSNPRNIPETGFMTNEAAAEIRKRADAGGWLVVFASDIRTLNQDESEDETDEKIQQNMQDQATWVKTISPYMSLLKFRLSWKPGKTKYLKGKIYFQYYPGNTSTEGRLLTDNRDNNAEIEYDNIDYESVMFHHNSKVRMIVGFRNSLENIDIGEKNHLMSDYDSVGEITAFEEYLNLKDDRIRDPKLVDRDGTVKSRQETIIEYSKRLDFACSEFRTLKQGGEISAFAMKMWDYLCEIGILDPKLDKPRYKNAGYFYYYLLSRETLKPIYSLLVRSES